MARNTEATKPAVSFTTFETTSPEGLRNALTTARKIASSDLTLPVLGQVHVKSDGDSLVLLATDRYQLVKIEVPGSLTVGGAPLDATVRIDAIDAVVKALGTATQVRRAHAMQLNFEHTDGKLTSVGATLDYEGGVTVRNPSYDGEYPRLDALLAGFDADEVDPRVAIAFDPDKLATVCAVVKASSVEQKRLALRFGLQSGRYGSADGRYRIIAQWPGVGNSTYSYMLMPVHCPEVSELQERHESALRKLARQRERVSA